MGQIEVAGDSLYSYGEQADGAVQLDRHHLPGFELDRSISLERPTGMGHVYQAGFVVLP